VVKRMKQANYRLWVEPEAYTARENLPGNIRQWIKRAIEDLEKDPYPSTSKSLDTTDLDVPPDFEFRRLRLEHWRVLYAINEKDGLVWVLAIHRRPPYKYEDLPELVSKLH